MIKNLGGVKQYLAWQRSQAAIGGANVNPDHPTNFRNNRELASQAGRKGGKYGIHANERQISGSKLGIDGNEFKK